jgi:hypothetical protein
MERGCFLILKLVGGRSSSTLSYDLILIFEIRSYDKVARGAGTIGDFSLLGGRSSAVKCPQEDRDAGLVWKHFPATPVKEFFTDWEGKYKSSEWMPVQGKRGGQSGEIFSQAKLGAASKEPAVSFYSSS